MCRHGRGSGRATLCESSQGPEGLHGANLYQQLLRIRARDNLDAEMEAAIQMLAEEFNDLKPAEEETRGDQENQSMWNLERN